MDENILNGLGLTDNEVKVYLSILQLGTCSGTEIRKHTKISNSQVYSALNTLITNGLITYEKRALGKKYTALDPLVIKKIHKFKIILDNPENKFFKQRAEEGLSEIKFMRGGFKSPAAIDIFQDYVYILLWDEHPYAIRVKNKDIADGFKTYFDFLWNMAKK